MESAFFKRKKVFSGFLCKNILLADLLKKSVHIRNGHRGHAPPLITEFCSSVEKLDLLEDLLNKKNFERSLEEKLKILNNLNDEILELISEDKARYKNHASFQMKLTIY